ncbi:MAG: tetratricopeptide repeat protein [Thermoanaerobaculia bacterium]
MEKRIEPPKGPASESGTPRAAAEAAIEICRSGDWGRGLTILADLVKERGLSEHIPGVAYSFLGYGIARYQKQVKEGLRLCEHAVRAQFYHPDCHLNLARVHVLAKNRKGAVNAIAQGLALDPKNAALRALQNDIGIRRKPVLGFLSRNNAVNRTLGKLRRQMKSTDD